MDTFSYISYLTSVVIALGLTRLFTGIGRLFQARGVIKLYWVHTLWTLNVLLFLLMNWWILFRWHTQSRWTFFLFLFVLVSPIIGFLLSVLLFPEPMPEGTDLKHHYYQNCRWFFALGSVLVPLDVVDTLQKGWDHFVRQGLLYVLTMAAFLTLMMVAASTRRERFHAFFAVFFMLGLLGFVGVNLNVLEG